MSDIPIVDIFSGPGGLGEGLHNSSASFRTVAAFEMDGWAHKTLALRAAFRELERRSETPDEYFALLRGEIRFGDLASRPMLEALEHAGDLTHQVELGPETREEYSATIKTALAGRSDFVLIGGPPCQAYSLVGRARRKNDVNFSEDKKHFLYREYLEILRRFSPTVFVMENVKGLLSSTHSGDGMFEKIFDDLSNPGAGVEYDVYSLVSDRSGSAIRPSDFVIRAERYGVPQRRHRVILIGVRRDAGLPRPDLLTPMDGEWTVRDAIGDLPPIRSRVSRSPDSLPRWEQIRAEVTSELSANVSSRRTLPVGSDYMPFNEAEIAGRSALASALSDARIPGAVHHQSRAHMESDLRRYFFAANYSLVEGSPPRLKDFPPEYLPNHANASSAAAPFSDRFNVQEWSRPSSTVVSHIAKDGHYYIHPDPSQMRSLTVREAARLQTFSDNYYFRGSQTDRYAQIGNAVPPILGKQIGAAVAKLLTSA